MIRTLQNILRQDRESFVIPRSVQDAIPIRRVWPDGVFQFGNKFSKTIRFTDINYAIASKEDKTSMFLGYSELLNALDAGSTTKITINNKRINRRNFEQDILLPRRCDALDGYRSEYNAMLMGKVTDSSNSVVQERYITLSAHRKSAEEARAFFDRVTADVTTRLNHLDAHGEELDAVERLRVLHDFYRTGEETEYQLDLASLMRKGHSFKDAICPDSFEFKKDHFVMGDKYGRVLFLREYASYHNYIKSGYRGAPPTLQDFHAELMRQIEPEARDVALAIELFTEGSLNTFAKQSNVNTNSRILCYDIRDLGKQLLPVGMLVVLDSVFNRVIRNRALGRNTWIYIDEIYLLFQHEYSANFLFTLWKRVRKYGACCTGLTQNIDDLLQSHTARTMLANSEFLVMLNQASTDRIELARLLNISDNQLSYITNVDFGRGLIKCGSSIVPFVDSFPRNTKLYHLMTTKLSDKFEENAAA